MTLSWSPIRSAPMIMWRSLMATPLMHVALENSVAARCPTQLQPAATACTCPSTQMPLCRGRASMPHTPQVGTTQLEILVLVTNTFLYQPCSMSNKYLRALSVLHQTCSRSHKYLRALPPYITPNIIIIIIIIIISFV